MNEFLVKLIANGGKGSGNFNPGQGRGVGKPGFGSGMSGKTSKEKTSHVPSKIESDTAEYSFKQVDSSKGKRYEVDVKDKRTGKTLFKAGDKLEAIRLHDSGDGRFIFDILPRFDEFDDIYGRAPYDSFEDAFKGLDKSIKEYQKFLDKFEKKPSSKKIDDGVKAFEDISDYLGNRGKTKSLLKEYRSDEQKAIDRLAEYTGSRSEAKRMLEAAEEFH